MATEKKMGYRCEFEHTDPNTCPWCGSTNIKVVSGTMAFEDGEDIDEVVCNACHREWSERSDEFVHEHNK